MFEDIGLCIRSGQYREAWLMIMEESSRLDRYSDKDAAKLFILEASFWNLIGDALSELLAISKGLSYDPVNYELFYMLGLHYLDTNKNQAFLCFEMALFYCDDEDDKVEIETYYNQVKDMPCCSVRKVSIMILSYNDLLLLKKCVESIERTIPPDCCEIVVVDNASTDSNTLSYLKTKAQSSIYNFEFIENCENLGFPRGCNVGVAYCCAENDIFFLNNDTVLMPNALFWLRMGLYENRNVGATGALSNQAPLQDIRPEVFGNIADETFQRGWHKLIGIEKSVELFSIVAKENGVPLVNPYKRMFRLTGFAMLVSREAIHAVAPDLKVFDERYSPGYFEDDDLGIRISIAGFEQYVCMNSFIYHDGGSGFEGHNEALYNSRSKFIDKWEFDITKYYDTWDEAVEFVKSRARELKRPPRVIDFTCGFGINASRIKCDIKEATVVGVCRNSLEAGIAQKIADDVAYGDLENCRLPWAENSFDIALAEKGTVTAERISRVLQPDGVVIWKTT